MPIMQSEMRREVFILILGKVAESIYEFLFHAIETLEKTKM